MAVLEINTNTEWLRNFSSIDFDNIDEADEDNAARDFISNLRHKLEDSGFDVENAKGQRSLLHGWNGAQGWKHNFGPVATFGDLTTEQVVAIESAIALAESEMIAAWKSDPKPTDDMIRELCIITTRNEAGRHFTEWSEYWDSLEAAGLIRINRPVHEATGTPYGMEHWTVEVTEEGLQVVDANPDLHPA